MLFDEPTRGTFDSRRSRGEKSKVVNTGRFSDAGVAVLMIPLVMYHIWDNRERLCVIGVRRNRIQVVMVQSPRPD